MNKINTDFGRRFKELRTKNGYTQEMLAEYLGVEARQISRIETGKCFTTLENLNKIAELYHIDVQDLFSFSHLKTKKYLIKAVLEMLNSTTEENCQTIFKITKDIVF